jgi:DNA-directed RNA polymerase subunit RPC12/RpoP
MFAGVVCKICGHRFSVPDVHVGRKITCPSCQSPVVAEAPAPAEGTMTAAPPAPSPSRTLLAPLEEPIRYSCPKCKKSLESPAGAAGQKLNCPGCGQRLQIPQPVAPQNKTMLAVDESGRGAPPPSTAPAPSSGPKPAPAAAGPIEVVEIVHETTTRPRAGNCLECGRSLAGRDTLLTCPDCGSLLCCSTCFRDHRRYAHERSRKRKRSKPSTGFRCRYCGTTEPPYYVSQISNEGWTVFVLMLVFCFPLFWIGLLMTEERRHCYDCGARLS